MLPVDVVFLHLLRSDAVEANIRTRAEDLSNYYPELLNCRVLVEQPNHHHATGNRFRVRIELGIPRREDLVVERGPAGKLAVADDDKTQLHKADEIDAEFTDVHRVVNQAFDAARKRLQTMKQRRRDTAHARNVRDKAAVHSLGAEE